MCCKRALLHLLVHAQGRVFRDSDPATVTYGHYRSRMNDVGTWRDISPGPTHVDSWAKEAEGHEVECEGKSYVGNSEVYCSEKRCGDRDKAEEWVAVEKQ